VTWWPRPGAGQRAHPIFIPRGGPRPCGSYQVSRAQRCADRRFPRSLLSVRGKGMRSSSPPGSGHRRNAVAAAGYATNASPARRWGGRVSAAAPSGGWTWAMLGGLAGPFLRPAREVVNDRAKPGQRADGDNGRDGHRMRGGSHRQPPGAGAQRELPADRLALGQLLVRLLRQFRAELFAPRGPAGLSRPARTLSPDHRSWSTSQGGDRCRR
jgi:hypothetical protein